ncbi:uncharacterized protein B0H64DRAFT_318673, partial [Chaetomium fimeti]
PFNYMDLGAQNILVDDNFNVLAIVDWEYPQTAPWQVNHYHMPFPLLGCDIEGILKTLPSYLAYKNVSRQDASRRLHRREFSEAERRIEEQSRPLVRSFPNAFAGPASRIYACFTTLSRLP